MIVLEKYWMWLSNCFGMYFYLFFVMCGFFDKLFVVDFDFLKNISKFFLVCFYFLVDEIVLVEDF